LFQAGDFAESDDGVRHRIVADAQTGCIVLTASEQRPEFLL
jgi:anti-sigma factor ChrR (cupin superfamily)